MLGEDRPKNAQEWLDVILNPQRGAHIHRDAGKKEFEDFVLGTWSKLVRQETRINGGKSSLAVFCRMDVGILLLDGNDRPQYFVNEVERTTTTSLWLRGHLNSMGTMADSFAILFRQWLADMNNPYIV